MGANIFKYLDEINRLSRKSLLLTILSAALAYSTVLSIVLFLLHWVYENTLFAWVGVFVPFLAGGAALGWVYSRRPSRQAAASTADSVLGNHDKYSTVLECIHRGKLNSVEKELVSRADFEASSADVKAVITVAPTRETKALALLVPVFLIIAATFGYYQVLRAITPVVEQAMLSVPVSKIQDKVNELAASGSPEKKEIADKLQKLLDKLKGAKDIDDMLGQAQSLLSQLQATETDPDVKETLNTLSQAASFLSRSKLTRQLSDALKDGDMSKAAGLASNLASKLQSMSGLTKKDLQKLGKNFQKSAAQIGQACAQGGG